MKNLINTLFGKKYYINIISDNTQDYIASTPFRTRKEANQHRLSLEDNRSIHFVKTLEVRIKHDFSTLPPVNR